MEDYSNYITINPDISVQEDLVYGVCALPFMMYLGTWLQEIQRTKYWGIFPCLQKRTFRPAWHMQQMLNAKSV